MLHGDILNLEITDVWEQCRFPQRPSQWDVQERDYKGAGLSFSPSLRKRMTFPRIAHSVLKRAFQVGDVKAGAGSQRWFSSSHTIWRQHNPAISNFRLWHHQSRSHFLTQEYTAKPWACSYAERWDSPFSNWTWKAVFASSFHGLLLSLLPGAPWQEGTKKPLGHESTWWRGSWICHSWDLRYKWRNVCFFTRRNRN